MLRVHGLYGHIRRNNLKSAVLVAGFLALFAILQTAILATVEHAPRMIPGMEGVDIEGVFASGPRIERRLGEFASSQADPSAARHQKSLAETAATSQLALMRFAREHMVALTVAFAAIYLVVATWWNSLYIRFAMRARPLQRREHPQLYDLVENLAITAGMPCPAIEVIENDNLNAYASGLTPAAARIGLTTGLVRALGRDELEAVIAHELTHIRYCDSRLMAITKACSDLVVSGLVKAIRQAREKPVQTLLPFAVLPFLGAGLFFLVLSVWCLAGLVMLATYLAKAMILHSREFVADAGAIELTKNPAALISALRKIAGADDIGITNPAAQAMMFSGLADGMLSTHPSIESRIAAIRAHGGSTASDEVAHRARRQPGVAAEVTGSRPVAARRSLAASPAGFAGPDRAAPAQGFGRRPRRISASPPLQAAAFSADEARFTTQAAAREVWRPEGVFSARNEPDQPRIGDSLFEQWVLSGRLDRFKQTTQNAGNRVKTYARRAILIYFGGMMLFGLLMSVLFR